MISDLEYIPNISSYEVFKYKAVDALSFSSSIWESNECTATIVICYSSCNSCIAPGTSDNHKCTSCDNVTYFRKENNNDNCYNNTILNQGYYFDQTYAMYKKCSIGCKTCNEYGSDENTHCMKCDFENNYFPLYDNPSHCKLNDGNIDGWVLQNNYFHKCYETCQTCSKTKDDKNDGCDVCKEGYMMSPLFSKTSVPKCDMKVTTWYYGFNYEFICLNVS